MLTDEMFQQIEETRQRYEARTPERETTKARLKAGGVQAANDPEEFNQRLEGIGIQPEAVPKGAVFADELVAPADPTLERVLGHNDLLGVAYLEIARRVASAIGCVRVRQNGRNLGAGTGFLVSPRLLMTNNHVFKNADMARESFVELDYEDDPSGQARFPARFDFEPDVFFLTDLALDYALVAVKETARDGQTPLSKFGYLQMLANEAKVLKGEALNIIQHPNGEPKQVALRSNNLVDMMDQWLHYMTDTAPGSSGSPVFNDQWQVVGLHHSGVPKKDEQGRILKRGGGLWSREMGDQWIDWIANEGARVSRLLAHIAAQPLDPAADALRKELLARAGPISIQPARLSAPLAATETRPLSVADANKVEDLLPQARQEERPEPALTVEDGVATWTIPLQISIRIGTPTLGGAGSGASSGAEPPRVVSEKPAPVVEPVRPAVTATQLPEPGGSSEVQEALQELAEAPNRVYYDAEADAADVKKYYTGILPDNGPDALYRALNKLLALSANRIPKYAPVKRVYPWVDLQPDLTIHSVYSGKVMNAKDLIEGDAQVQQQRAARASELFMREASLSPEELEAEYDALELALPYNCEHVVCQSWFRKAEPMKGDMHHLFACESRCNSFRNNNPYFDFQDILEIVRDDCGRLEEGLFEPQTNKGPVARAVLYFLLMYPGKVNSVGNIYDEERVRTFVEWHKAFAVTEHERHRNQAIFAVQGNRNPLVDFPEWAEKINFMLGL